MAFTNTYTIQDCVDRECLHYSEIPSDEGGYYPICDRQGDSHDGHFCRFLDREREVGL